MAPSTSTLLRYHQHHLSPEVFHPLQLKCSIHQILTPHFLLPQLLETTILLSVSINLTTLGGSYEWNRIVFVLLWLAHLSIKPSSCSIRQNFLPFWGWIIFHCVHIPRFICSLIGHVGCSYISAIVSNTAMNIGARTPFYPYFLSFPTCMRMWDCWIVWLFYVSFFERLPYCFPQRLHRFTSQPAVHKGFSYSASSATSTRFFFFDGSHPNGYVVLICISQVINDGSVVKYLTAKAGDAGNTGSIPRLGRCPRVGNGNLL